LHLANRPLKRVLLTVTNKACQYLQAEAHNSIDPFEKYVLRSPIVDRYKKVARVI